MGFAARLLMEQLRMFLLISGMKHGAYFVAVRGPWLADDQCHLKLNYSKSCFVERPTPNPSIEGMPKRLRLSVTPHVKR
jgi:hypothetical protein